jgi:hypothetical protein
LSLNIIGNFNAAARRFALKNTYLKKQSTENAEEWSGAATGHTYGRARKQTCGWGVDGGQVIMHRYEQ